MHTNKNENGIWLVSAIAAKLAGKGNPTTHVKNGGTIKSLHELSLPLNKEDIYRSLSTAALSISKAIDRKMDGEIGEIGFDFGIDNNGNIWLFEANSKPGRSIFMHKDLQQEDRLTLRFPFQYAEYLMKKQFQLRRSMMPHEMLVGILAGDNDRSGSFYGNISLFKAIQRHLAEQNSSSFVFTPSGMKEKSIVGYIYEPNENRWLKKVSISRCCL